MNSRPSHLHRLSERQDRIEGTLACGNCGERFASKADKRRHKIGCQPQVARFNTEADENNDEDAYGRFHITPEVKLRANLEWRAMDPLGRLPDGWDIDAALESYRKVRNG